MCLMDSLFTDSAFIEGCIWVKSEKKTSENCQLTQCSTEYINGVHKILNMNSQKLWLVKVSLINVALTVIK